MELMEVIRKRRSIRKYKPDPVSREDIEYVLEAARLAPSWANTQCWHFIVVTTEDNKNVLAQQGMPFTNRAPVVIVLSTDPYPQYREMCRQLGADFFLDKDTEFDRVNKVLGTLGYERSTAYPRGHYASQRCSED